MAWRNPLHPIRIVPDPESEGFLKHEAGTTGLPIGDRHPGAFGYVRANHVHEGVDLYCPEGTPVSAVEDGVVVAVIEFTGSKAEPPSTWWHDTQAVLVEGASGVVVYGEIGAGAGIREGVRVKAGEPIGHVRQVLVKPKTPPRPMSMLHLELRGKGCLDPVEWTKDGGRPSDLLDPTQHMLDAIAPGNARLHLSTETLPTGSQYRLQLVGDDRTTDIGAIRQLAGGGWEWNVALPSHGDAPSFEDAGVAYTAEIARDRQFSSLEEHDPHRFRRTASSIEKLHASLAHISGRAETAGDDIADLEEVVAAALFDAGADAATLAEQFNVVLPERARFRHYLEMHGAKGLKELADKALERLDRIYPVKR